MEAWSYGPLAVFPYVYLDAHYEKVRQDFQVRDLAILIAGEVDLEGKRHIMGVPISLGEQEVH